MSGDETSEVHSPIRRSREPIGSDMRTSASSEAMSAAPWLAEWHTRPRRRDRLPIRNAAIWREHLAGLTHRQIAERYDLSRGGARNLIAKLRKELQCRGDQTTSPRPASSSHIGTPISGGVRGRVFRPG